MADEENPSPDFKFREEHQVPDALIEIPVSVVKGSDGIEYIVPQVVADRISGLQRQANELRREIARLNREHRAELAEALGTPKPDPTPLEAGDEPPVLR